MSRQGLELDAGAIAEIVDRLGATQGQASYAIRQAANHAARLAQRMGKARINDALQVSLPTLRRRLKQTTAQGVRSNGKVRYSSASNAKTLRARARAWFGLNPIEPVGGLTVPVVWSSDRKTRRSGVTAGRYRWDRAFLATMPTGSKGVFRRKGKGRLPIIRQLADIDAPAFAIISSDIFPVVSAEFYRRVETELVKIITEMKTK